MSIFRSCRHTCRWSRRFATINLIVDMLYAVVDRVSASTPGRRMPWWCGPTTPSWARRQALAAACLPRQRHLVSVPLPRVTTRPRSSRSRSCSRPARTGRDAGPLRPAPALYHRLAYPAGLAGGRRRALSARQRRPGARRLLHHPLRIAPVDQHRRHVDAVRRDAWHRAWPDRGVFRRFGRCFHHARSRHPEHIPGHPDRHAGRRDLARAIRQSAQRSDRIRDGARSGFRSGAVCTHVRGRPWSRRARTTCSPPG